MVWLSDYGRSSICSCRVESHRRARNGVRPMNEIFPLERASEAYDRMMSGKARFRVVLTLGG